MPISFFSGQGNSYGSAVPFARISEPAQMGTFLNLEQSELLRVQRYHEGWRFYFGRQWLFKREDGEPLVTINYFRKFIDKSVAFLVGKSFLIKCPEALEEISKPFLDEVWEYNQKQQFAFDAATMGGVTGDAFAMVTYEEPTLMQRRINPFSEGKIRVNLLGSEQVYPTWDPLNINTLTAVRIETIYYSDRNLPVMGMEDRNHEGRQLYTKRFTQIITPDQIIEQFHGEMPMIRPNALGEIPVVHIKNMSIPKEYYGLPDAQDLIDLQRELNEKATDISDIINYYGSPITVITGAKAKQLQRGPKQIWSGLPEKATVKNLELTADLGAANNYWELIKKAMHELADIPEGALGSMQPISNTSGVALHTQYQPLLEKTDRKRIQYEPGFEQINYFILRIGATKGLIRLPFDLCSSCGGRIIEINSGKTTYQWDPFAPNPNDGTQGFYVEVPVMEKRCYHIDKQTLEFTDPHDMRLKFWHQYGFGNQLRELRLKEIEAQIESGEASFWDYTQLQTKLMDKWKEQNLSPEQQAIHAHAAGMQAFPTETGIAQATTEPQGGVTTTHDASSSSGEKKPPTPSKKVSTEQPAPSVTMPEEPMPVPPPQLKILPLPPQDIDIPEEPEHVMVNKTWLHPNTGQIVMVKPENLFLVPTGCTRPQYLNPFKNKVHFLDVLPKDEAQQAQLYSTYQQNRWVDAEWVRGRISEIAHDKTAIERRMKEKEAPLLTMQPTQSQEMPTGGFYTSYQELAPPAQDMAAVPGAGGNPVPQGSA